MLFYLRVGLFFSRINLDLCIDLKVERDAARLWFGEYCFDSAVLLSYDGLIMIIAEELYSIFGENAVDSKGG